MADRQWRSDSDGDVDYRGSTMRACLDTCLSYMFWRYTAVAMYLHALATPRTLDLCIDMCVDMALICVWTCADISVRMSIHVCVEITRMDIFGHIY